MASHELRGEMAYRELVVRSLRSAGAVASHDPRPGPAGRLRPAGVVAARPARGPRRCSRPAATSPCRSCWPPGRAGSRRSCGRATSSPAARPGRSAATRRAWPSASRRPSTRSRATASCPARRSARSPASTAMRPASRSASLRDERLLLVFGGSQAVARLSAATTAALPRLLADWHVLHLAGEKGMADAGAARQAAAGVLRPRYIAEPFLTDRMADALVAADLVLGRAGSSTCAEVAAVGVASILVPYPYAGAHQRYNADVPRRRGRRGHDRRRGARRRSPRRRGVRSPRRRSTPAHRRGGPPARPPRCGTGAGRRAAGDGRCPALPGDGS